MAKSRDFTQGPILKNIILFAIPLCAMGLLQLLFNAVDQIVIGRYSGTESLAAVGSNGALITLILNVFIGTSVGANVVMARAIGAKDEKKAQRVLHTSLLFSLICGLTLGLICFFMARSFLTWVNCDEAVIGKATQYLKIYFLGVPGTLVYNFGAAILRANGDTRRPFIFLVIAGVLNVLLNLLFVVGCNLDVVGVALGTIISQYASLVLLVICLLKEKGVCKLSIKKLHLHKSELWEIVSLGVPSGLNGACFSLGNIIMQSAVNTLGSVAMASASVSATLDGAVYYSMYGVAQATLTFVGQNYGAKNIARIKKGVISCAIVVTGVGLLFTGAELLLLRPLISLFSSDGEVIEMARRLLMIYIPLYFTCGIMEVLVYALRGLGYSVTPTIISIIFVCGLRIVWTYAVFPKFLTLASLYICHPIGWFSCALCNLIIFIFVYKKVKNKFSLEEKDIS